ncbi:hypothetical protein [uncultured Stenotrophomonas sp.]|uniref:hypothetical protein n=1 Tax=uncultured Stenotrophomonas sp. TaxID=165438 RepID=UPI0025CEB8C9|nr:hypothetical protein [uncultured Stenotrophomonas sp.]
MIRPLLVLVFIGLLADTAAASVQDHRCLSGGRDDRIHLEWRWLDDGGADVRYAGQRERLTLRRVSMETMVLAEDRPYQFDSVWEERIDGRVNGRYRLSTQGALVLDLSYKRARDGRTTAFHDDPEAWQEEGCHWPGGVAARVID